jgi:hypothetical protein
VPQPPPIPLVTPDQRSLQTKLQTNCASRVGTGTTGRDDRSENAEPERTVSYRTTRARMRILELEKRQLLFFWCFCPALVPSTSQFSSSKVVMPQKRSPISGGNLGGNYRCPNLTPGRLPLVNSTPAFSKASLIAAKVSGLATDLPRSIA